MGRRTAEAQREYRERQKSRVLDIEMRMRSNVMKEIARTFRITDADPLLAMAETLPIAQQAILLGTLLSRIEPKNFMADAGGMVMYATEPHVWVKDGKLAIGIDLAAAPAGA